MDASAKYELESIKRELNSIISELESISRGVRYDFVGIGSEKCADCLDGILGQYYEVRRQLNNLDTSTTASNVLRPLGTIGMGGR